jgi:hypothetical protein
MATFLERALAGVSDTFGSGDSSLSSFLSFLVFFDLDYEFSSEDGTSHTSWITHGFDFSLDLFLDYDLLGVLIFFLNCR